LREIKTSFEDEERFINIGKISSKVYAVVITYRQAIIKTWLADKIMQLKYHQLAV
jgi:uncharacterized DUF497 family protein